MKKVSFLLLCCFLWSCSYFSGGVGQLVYHWERNRTGVERFVRDHNECLKYGKAVKWVPDFKSWFYTEETKLDTRADWNSAPFWWHLFLWSFPLALKVTQEQVCRSILSNLS